MLERIKEILHSYRYVAIVSLVLTLALVASLVFGGAAIKTIAFFVLIEVLILAIVGIAGLFCYRNEKLQEIVRHSFSNFILGIHLCAGMLVLGVYFTI